jgi:CheY-like chemotaxis protein
MDARILILDDEENFANMVRDLLADHGYNAHAETSPKVALDLLRSQHYELVIADFKMPEMDGAELLLQLRKTHPRLPVIMISGLMNTPDLLRVANQGVALVLEKPFDTKLFLEYVGEFVNPPKSASFGLAEPNTPEVYELTFHKRAVGESPYPQGSAFFADTSLVSQQFLQKVWERVSAGHVFVDCPEGAETQLLAQEVARWLHQGSVNSIERLGLNDLGSVWGEALLDRIEHTEGLCMTVLVEGNLQNDPASIQRLMEWVQYSRNRVNPEKACFIYALSNCSEFQMRMHSQLKNQCLHFPVLFDRPSDIGYYIHKFVNISRVKSRQFTIFTTEAIRMLIGYGWPGNYKQLQRVMNRLMVVAKDGRVTSDKVEKAFLHDHVHLNSTLKVLRVEEYLHQRQHAYLKSMDRGDLEETLRAAGVPDERIDLEHAIDAQRFLFPELLEQKG